MTKFTVTLKALRAAGACFEGYNKLVRSLQGKAFTEEDAARASYLHYNYEGDISVLQILESNGIDDALWSLCCVEGCDKDIRLYAVWCARQVQHLMSDNRSITALDIAEQYANGLVTKEELKTARDAAWDAASYAASYAAGAAASDAARAAAGAAASDAARATASDAARATAGAAAWATASDAARVSQKDMLVRMINNTATWQG